MVLVFVWAIALGTNPAGKLTAFSGRTWLFLALSGCATGLSWLCYFRALQLGEASRVAPIDKLSVVLVLGMSALFLGESLSWKTLLGGVMIAGGAILVALK